MVMTVKQVAEKIQVTPRTVYDWIRQGKLQAYRAGRQYRITDEQLEAFLTQKKEQCGSAPNAGGE